MMPEAIRARLETLDLQSYAEAKEYAMKQAWNLKNTSETSTFDPLENEEEMEDNKKKGLGSKKRVRRRRKTRIPGKTCSPG